MKGSDKVRNQLVKARGNKTQTHVAGEIGISQKYLSKLELGQRTPSLRIASKIATYYGYSIEYLFPDIFLGEKSSKSSKNIIKEY